MTTPRCMHGNDLRDYAFEKLEPSCGCGSLRLDADLERAIRVAYCIGRKLSEAEVEVLFTEIERLRARVAALE